MTIPLTGGTGIFTRLGHVAKVLSQINVWQQTTLTTVLDNLGASIDGTVYRAQFADIASLYTSGRIGAASIMANLQADAQALVVAMVKADQPARAGSLSLALQELIRQMVAATASVQSCTIGATATAFSTPANTGDGKIILSTKRGDGLVQEDTIAETVFAVCTADSQTGGTTLGQERFTFTGALASPSVWDYDWQTGSAASLTLNAVEPNVTSQSQTANLLNNSGFETFTANLPNNWTQVAGTAGTDFQQSTGTKYDSGTGSLQYVGGGTAPNIKQQFGAAGGTTATLIPNTSYALNVWIKNDVVPAAGVITFELVDGTDTVINDAQGVANSFTVTRAQTSTSWQAFNGVFRTPAKLPSAAYLRIRTSTGITAGSSFFFDRMAMTPLTAIYPGGPGVALFSGATQFIGGDGWTIAATNNRGGASNAATFQAFFDRVFAMRSLGLLLPSSGSPTVSDSLIA